MKEIKFNFRERKLKHPGVVMGLFALALEATGVAAGAYVYGDFPIKILGVPLCIPVMWVLVMAMAYVVSERYGPAIGVLARALQAGVGSFLNLRSAKRPTLASLPSIKRGQQFLQVTSSSNTTTAT